MRLRGSLSSECYKVLAAALGAVVGVAGLYISLWDGKIISIPLVSEQKDPHETVYTVAGLQNLGNNCFLNVILQALASSSWFLSFIQNILLSDDLVTGEKGESMPLIDALSSLLKELNIVRDEKSVLNPRKVMLAMESYARSFNLTRQQDAAEAFIHLLSALEEEISECYMLRDTSLADATTSPCKIYKLNREGQNECERWKQHFLGPFDGTIGSSLKCKSCLSTLSMDFEFFRCLPLSPVLDKGGEIMRSCTLMDCFQHFTAVEHVENYRCTRCWHVAALKYLSGKREENKDKMKILDQCINIDSCNCKNLILPEVISLASSSCASKCLSIARCPKILCVHLQRASMNVFGEFIKLQGFISFPLLLDLFPFTQTNVGLKTLEDCVQKLEKQQAKLLAPQQHNYLNMQQGTHMFPQIYKLVSERLSADTLSSNMLGNSTYEPFGRPRSQISEAMARSGMSASDLRVSQAGHISQSGPSDKVQVGRDITSTSSKQCMYHLVSVVEHYGMPGSGHYAVYRRPGNNTSGCAASAAGPLETLNQQWVYISDREVSSVSEEDVLAAEASLLFYERIET